MFIGEGVTHFQTHTFHVEAIPLSKMSTGTGQQTWKNFGFDHLAITVADRADAKAFFSEVLGMTLVRDDRHQLVLTTGNTALFCFDAEKAPLSDGLPSRWHHIGFVVDNLDAAYHHLAYHAQLRRERIGDGSGSIASDFTLLERERDPGDRLDDTVVGLEPGMEVVDLEQRHQVSSILGSRKA